MLELTEVLTNCRHLGIIDDCLMVYDQQVCRDGWTDKQVSRGGRRSPKVCTYFV